MPFSVEGLTVQDFTDSSWRDAVEAAEERDCNNYRTMFYTKATEARTTGDERAANLFNLLGDLASMFIDADDLADPLKPMWQSGGQRSAIPSDFDPALGYLADILPQIDDPELKARVADVLWLRKRDFKAAREGAAAYLAAARLVDRDDWPHATDRIERAVDIAARVNQQDLLDAVTHQIVEGLAAFDGTEVSFLPARLMEILQKRNTDDPAHFAALAASFSVAAERRDDWYAARIYWDIQAGWHKINKDGEATRVSRLQSADTFVREAEARVSSGGGQGHMVAAHLLESAIQALRAVGGQQEKIAELHRRLLDHQRQSVSEMKPVSVEFDGSEMIARATEAVAGRDLYNAAFGLALLGAPPSIMTLRGQAQRQLQNSVMSLFPMQYKNAMGRTVARRDPPEGGETQAEADLRIEMYKVASMGHSLQVQGYIEPARAQILREHTVRVADLMALFRDNPFVPPGREEFFARGLQAGFGGDFATAAHLLVPQVENSVRYILEQRGVITSGLDDEGIQDERDLNRTLRLPEFAEPLKEVLGEDLLFDLRGLLIERYGSNLRNDLAHGLLDYYAFFTPPCIYLWWLTLRLCCIPVITSLRQQAAEEAGDPAEAAEQSRGSDGGRGEDEETE